MQLYSRLLVAALVSVLLFSCASDKEKSGENADKKVVSNPNGDSELALAMRTIFDQTEVIKQSLNEGKLVVPEGYIENLRIFHTAKPTDPEVKVDEFYGFVKAIDLAAENLQNTTDLDLQKEQYGRVLNACVQCHQQFCPGPIRRIKKLRLPTVTN